MTKLSMLTALACVFIAGPWAAAHAEADQPMAIEVTGTNVNLVKALCGDDAPEADADFGGLNALRVEEAIDSEGNVVEGMTGKLLHYLPVAAASSLISGDSNADKTVIVKGRLYRDALTLAVQEFETTDSDESAEKKDNWDDWEPTEVNSGSQQQVI